MDLKRVTVVLRPELHKKLKYLSYETGRTLQQLYVQAVEEFLQRHSKPAADNNDNDSQR